MAPKPTKPRSPALAGRRHPSNPRATRGGGAQYQAIRTSSRDQYQRPRVVALARAVVVVQRAEGQGAAGSPGRRHAEQLSELLLSEILETGVVQVAGAEAVPGVKAWSDV